MAGINAHLKVKEKAPLILKGRSIHRSADDLITKGTEKSLIVCLPLVQNIEPCVKTTLILD
jgi:hypothetical protein